MLAVDGLPTSYVPGTVVDFEVLLSGAENLGAYNIDLVLESNQGFAGTDFFFDVVETAPVTAGYVFPSSDFFADAVNTDSPSRHRITLTDFDLAGVDTVAGINDGIADVSFRTSMEFTGTLALSFESTNLILDTPDISPTPIVGYEVLQDALQAALPIQLPPVPEPTTYALVLATLCLTMGRRWFL